MIERHPHCAWLVARARYRKELALLKKLHEQDGKASDEGQGGGTTGDGD